MVFTALLLWAICESVCHRKSSVWLRSLATLLKAWPGRGRSVLSLPHRFLMISIEGRLRRISVSSVLWKNATWFEIKVSWCHILLVTLSYSAVCPVHITLYNDLIWYPSGLQASAGTTIWNQDRFFSWRCILLLNYLLAQVTLTDSLVSYKRLLHGAFGNLLFEYDE